MLNKAIIIAAKAHDGQFDKGGNQARSVAQIIQILEWVD